MLTGHDMARALRTGAAFLDEKQLPDSADRCRAGADEIERLINVIRTRDKHIRELQSEIFISEGSDETKLDAALAALRPFAAIAPLFDEPLICGPAWRDDEALWEDFGRRILVREIKNAAQVERRLKAVVAEIGSEGENT